jgi:S-adenosylmethionine decarboxylase
MTVGIEWLVDAEGCRADLLRDADALGRLCEQIIAGLDLHVVRAGLWHRFPPPGGVTGLFLLTESHLACHSYPETGVATFNLYCCRPRPRWPWEERLRAALGARCVTVRSLTRGDPTSSRPEEGGRR